MSFAQEGYLLYLWLIPILLLVFWAGERLLARRLTRFANLDNLNRLYQRPRYRVLSYCCLVSSFVVLVIALAQPRFGYRWLEQQQQGKDIYVVLDVSKSMLAADIKPSRLQRAKRKLHDLLTMLDGDRISLIAFAGASFVHCPLTNDYAAAQLFLDHLSPELIPVQGTAIGDALQLALKSINETSTAEGAAIILLTDGEDQGTNPLKVAEQAKQQQVKIFAIGIGGNEGIPITTNNGDLIKDRQGNLVLSRLDETTLQQLAIITGGSYVRSVSGDFDLQQIYDKGIHKIADQEFAESGGKRRVWHEHFYLFILIALLLLVIEFITKGYRQPLIGLLLFVALNRPVVARDGHDAFADKDYQQAARQFLQQEIDNPDDLELTYNRAVSQYFNKNYQGAASGFAKATKDPKLALKSWFNLGNSQVALNRLKDAQHSYQQALKLDPNNHKAKENLEWVNQQLQKQEQQDQQQNQQQDQQQNQQQNQQQDQQQNQQQNQQQEQEQQQQQQQQQNEKQGQQSTGDQRALSEEEIAKLLRQLDDKIGVKPRKLTPAERNNVQDW